VSTPDPPPPSQLAPSATAFSTRLRELPVDELPREKFQKRGPGALTDAELLALVFGTGTKGLNVIDMSRQLLARFGSLQDLSRLDWKTFRAVPGIGETKAQYLAATFELSKRLARSTARQLSLATPDEVAAFVGADLRAESREVIRIILLNTKLRFQHMETIALGSINECTARIAEILRPAIIHTAHSFILVHNHPSGDPLPSQADIDLTRRLNEASRQLGLRLQDHLIIGLPRHSGDRGYFSFREGGLL
jgi:DNA repair protein RadC